MQFTAVADDARQALGLMAVPAATVDPAGALARVKARAREKTPPGRSSVMVLRGSWRRPFLGGLAAAVVAVGLVATTALTPLGANLIQVFQPTKIQPVSVQQSDLAGLDAFASWGDVKWTRMPELKEAGSAAEAAQISGLPAIHVDTGRLPAGLAGAPVGHAAVGQSSGSVTFNGKAPARLNGSTLTVVVGPAETAVYGDLSKLTRTAGGSGSGAGAEGSKPAGGSGASQPTADNVKNALAAAGPIMAVAEMRAPQVSSTGASVADIKNALLAQPGLSPTVRAAIKSIDDPKGRSEERRV